MKVEELIYALDYIEENIESDIHIQDIADHCYVSLSALQKTFKYVFHISINDYIIRRRFSCAAKELIESDDNILDIALKYGYSNAESFTRGFKKVWDINPYEYRKHRKFTSLTPKLSVVFFLSDEKERIKMTRYDLTELYDVLQLRKNNAYVVIDLHNMSKINKELGRKAGDAALLELIRRVEENCAEDDIFLRTGGDEFVVFTNSEDMTHANDIVSKVSAQNGRSIQSEGVDVPVSVYIGAFKHEFSHHVNVNDMFASINNEIEDIHRA